MKKSTLSNTPLVGQQLLAQMKKLDSHSREEKARRCGYSSLSEDGSERLHMVKFMNALLDAEGINVDSEAIPSDRKAETGRAVSFRVSVQANGNIVIGSTYTKMMSLEYGDQFEISLKRNQIHLSQLDDQIESNDERI